MIDEVHRIPAFEDNYLWLLRCGRTTAAIDPGDAKAIDLVLARLGLGLDFILNTHHHWDHVGGNIALKKKYGCKIFGPEVDAHRIPGIDETIRDGDTVKLGATTAQVLFTPGHTHGHVIYFFPDDKKVFVGDTLFALGCGRLFEGTAEQMWQSLKRIRAMPADTLVYCAHEYSAANAKFCLTIDPKNKDLTKLSASIMQLRQDNQPTVPFLLAEELQANPFLRADVPELQQMIGLPGERPELVFAEIRRRKDHY